MGRLALLQPAKRYKVGGSVFPVHGFTVPKPQRCAEWPTCNQPGRAVWSELIPEAAEEVQELERLQAHCAGGEGVEGHATDEE